MSSVVAGIYGLMAYLAALRRREIAIRMALGATNALTAVLTAMVVLVARFVATVGPISRVAKLAPAQVLLE